MPRISTPDPAGLRRRGRAEPRPLAHPPAEFQRQRWGTGRQPGTTRYKLACLVLANRRQRSARRADAAAAPASRPGAAATLTAPSAALRAAGREQDCSKPLCQEADPPRRAAPFAATAPRWRALGGGPGLLAEGERRKRSTREASGDQRHPVMWLAYRRQTILRHDRAVAPPDSLSSAASEVSAHGVRQAR